MFQKALITALVALAVHASLLVAKVSTHPSHSVLAAFHLGGAQSFHPAFVAEEGYPLDRSGYGTDGQQYLYVAHDPLARGDEMARAIDAPRYRYGRILLPGMAWLTCAGDSPCLPRAILGWNFVFAAGIGATLAVLVAETGASWWWGLVLACSGSLACATDIANVELAGQFFGLLGVLAFSRRWTWTAALAWSLAALARESYILVPLGFAVAELLPLAPADNARRDLGRWSIGRAGAALGLLVALVPCAAWNVYLRTRLPPQASNGGASNLTFPFLGILDHVVSFVREPRVTGSTVVTFAVGFPLLLIMGRHCWAMRRDRSGIALATALFALMGVVAAPQVWLRAGGFARALDFIYPGAVLSALKRGDRTTALLAMTTLIQTVNILFDHLLVPVPR